jgi:hypothetical protein
MPSTRTQVYLTDRQRARLDEVRRHEGKTLAELVREALDQYLEVRRPEARRALEDTFGAAPGFTVPTRDEWDARG